MDNASVAVLLISHDSLTSAFILREEVTHLLERRDKDGLYIVPIVVRPCAWKQVKWLTQMQIRITPDRDNRKKKKQLLFSVEIFFLKHEMDIEYWPTDGDDKPRSLENVPQLLEYLLARHTDAPQVIEFFLPGELISGDVDQWAMTQSVLLQTKFGIEYQIVVRSLDRLALLGNQFRDHWKMRWHQFQEVSQAPGTKHLMVCNRGEYQPQVLYRALLRSHDTTCLGLTFIPTELSGSEDIFCAIIQAGIPVALWPRPCGDASWNPEHTRTKIDAMVANTALLKLPSVIQQERQQADDQNDATHPGNHWTLLWDDPTRLPPTWLLTPPQSERYPV